MKRGFTLVELLGVIVVLGILAVLIFPAIINQITSAQNDIDETSNALIYDAAENYVLKYAEINENSGQEYYCVTLEELVNEGLLNEPIKNVETGKEYDLAKTSVMIEYKSYANFYPVQIGPTINLSCINVEAESYE